ncbi:DUF4333 domain-containing protein [Ilumatobacter sp.]|uniref:DUF4333 domain-containing protein n=1 Tax=Ilumatobacter sp. TaxID=1967498 RepID=UPI003C5D832F
MQRRLSIGLVSALLVTAAGCSFSIGGKSPESAGEELIEGELSEKLGVDLTDADCTEPADDEPGEEFTCTATTPDGETITFQGVVETDDEIFVAASNVIIAEEMAVVEEEAAAVLGPEVGVEIDPSQVECPEETTVLDGDELRCEIVDADNGDRYVLTATFGGYVLHEGFDERYYEIGDLIE